MIKNEKLEYKKFDKSMNEPLSLSYLPDEKIQIVIDKQVGRGYGETSDWAFQLAPYLDWKSMQAFLAVNRNYFLAGMDYFTSLDEKTAAKHVEKAFETATTALGRALPVYHEPEQLASLLEMMITQMWRGVSTKTLLAPFHVDRRPLEEEAETAECLLDCSLGYCGFNVLANLSFGALYFMAMIAAFWSDSPEKLSRLKTPATVLGIIIAIGLCLYAVNYLRKKSGCDEYVKEKVKARGFAREAKLLGLAPETPADSQFRCAAQSLIWHRYGPPPKYQTLADSLRTELQSGPGQG